MKLALTAFLALTACSPGNLSPIDYADAGTTAAGFAIVDGVTEGNPLALGPAAPVVGLVLKSATKSYLRHRGYSKCDADRIVGTGSAFGTANNIAIISGVTGYAPLVFGVAGALTYRGLKKCPPKVIFVEVTE